MRKLSLSLYVYLCLQPQISKVFSITRTILVTKYPLSGQPFSNQNMVVVFQPAHLSQGSFLPKYQMLQNICLISFIGGFKNHEIWIFKVKLILFYMCLTKRRNPQLSSPVPKTTLHIIIVLLNECEDVSLKFLLCTYITCLLKIDLALRKTLDKPAKCTSDGLSQWLFMS